VSGRSSGIDTDKGLYEHFRRHYRDWFPALGRVHRTTFVHQAANLWAVKAQLRQQLLGRVGFDPQVSILDSFPIPVCRFGRAYHCRRLAGLAAFGRDEGAKQTYDGLLSKDGKLQHSSTLTWATLRPRCSDRHVACCFPSMPASALPYPADPTSRGHDWDQMRSDADGQYRHVAVKHCRRSRPLSGRLSQALRRPRAP